VIERFRKHDEEMLLKQMAVRKEEKQLISLNQQGRRDLEQLLGNELFAQVDQNDAAANEERREDKARGQ
jgi:ribosome-binding protein aMBF1 (putative translation factor)